MCKVGRRLLKKTECFIKSNWCFDKVLLYGCEQLCYEASVKLFFTISPPFLCFYHLNCIGYYNTSQQDAFIIDLNHIHVVGRPCFMMPFIWFIIHIGIDRNKNKNMMKAKNHINHI